MYSPVRMSLSQPSSSAFVFRRPTPPHAVARQFYLMTSTSGAVRVTSGLESGQQSVVEQRTVVEMVAATERPGRGAVALPRRRHRVQDASLGRRRRLVLAASGRRAESGSEVRRPSQLPDVRVAVLSLSTGAGRGDAVQLADVFGRFARGRQHQRYVGRHSQRSPRAIERPLPAVYTPTSSDLSHCRRRRYGRLDGLCGLVEQSTLSSATALYGRPM